MSEGRWLAVLVLSLIAYGGGIDGLVYLALT